MSLVVGFLAGGLVASFFSPSFVVQIGGSLVGLGLVYTNPTWVEANSTNIGIFMGTTATALYFQKWPLGTSLAIGATAVVALNVLPANLP